MKKLFVRILLNMIAIWVAAYLIAGISYPSLGSLFFAAVIFAVVNAVIKPILVIISFPLTLLTLGLFLLVINGITVEITAMFTGLRTATFMTSIQAGIIIAISNWILYKVFNKSLK